MQIFEKYSSLSGLSMCKDAVSVQLILNMPNITPGIKASLLAMAYIPFAAAPITKDIIVLSEIFNTHHEMLFGSSGREYVSSSLPILKLIRLGFICFLRFIAKNRYITTITFDRAVANNMLEADQRNIAINAIDNRAVVIPATIFAIANVLVLPIPRENCKKTDAIIDVNIFNTISGAYGVVINNEIAKKMTIEMMITGSIIASIVLINSDSFSWLFRFSIAKRKVANSS